MDSSFTGNTQLHCGIDVVTSFVESHGENTQLPLASEPYAIYTTTGAPFHG